MPEVFATQQSVALSSIIAKTLAQDMGADNLANPREIREKPSLQEPKAPPLAKNSSGERGYWLLRLFLICPMNDVFPYLNIKHNPEKQSKSKR